MENSGIFSDTFFAMGTRCDVVFPGIESELGEQIFQIIKSEINYLEKELSRFIPESTISNLNKASKKEWLTLSEDIWEIITTCLEFYRMSNGAFDITTGPLISLWKKKSIPTIIEIEQALRRTGFDKVEFDFENHAIRFLEDGMEFDLGAVGKGIALDTIKPILHSQGIKNGLISFGESSILALGNHPNGDYWPLGIRNQYTNDDFVHVFQTSNEVLTSSGTIFTDDHGEVKTRQHIISPVDGKPVSVNKTVSVKSKSGTLGEFISTAWLILPEKDKTALSEKLKNIEILETIYLEDNSFKTKLNIL